MNDIQYQRHLETEMEKERIRSGRTHLQEQVRDSIKYMAIAPAVLGLSYLTTKGMKPGKAKSAMMFLGIASATANTGLAAKKIYLGRKRDLEKKSELAFIDELNKIAFHRGHLKTIGHLGAAAAAGASTLHALQMLKRKREWKKEK